MIITQSRKIAEHVRSLRNHGITRSLLQRYSKGNPWDYDVIEPGYNYRLDEIRSVLGTSQLKQVTKLNAMRKKAFEYYNQKLCDKKGITIPELPKHEDHACHLYIIKIQKEYELSRDDLFKKLLSLGIRTSVHYKPLHKFTIIKKRGKIIDSVRNSENTYHQIISLPMYPSITRKEQNYVIEAI